ncbi:MAG: S46 family peptidase [Saprospiraceae bacterium]
MRKVLSILIIQLIFQFSVFSQGGMWLPSELKGQTEKDMKKLGLKIKADKIYNETEPSIKDAIVKFGGGCTGSVISNQGLIITNHHCGYGSIQRLSTVENNLLQNGFWAESFDEELPANGMTVTFVEQIIDVTDEILSGVNDDMSMAESQSVVDLNINRVKSRYTEDAFHTIEIKPFYYGNKYYLFKNLIFKDIRLVGVAPEAVGKFGADTDNWMWPRHNADFSIFRIYADKNNNPAEYSDENIPYKSKYYLPVSKGGLEENDFTMVFGFPELHKSICLHWELT